VTAPALASRPLRDPIAEGRAALEAGDPVAAANLLYPHAQAQPGDPDSRYWLYSALVAAGEAQLARQVLDDARTLHCLQVLQGMGVDTQRLKADRAYAADIGQRLYGNQLMAPASFALGCSLDFDRLDPQRMLSYGLSLQHQGRMDEAITVFQAAADAFQNPVVHEFLLYALFHAPERMRRVSEEARRWGELYAAPLTPAKTAFANERTAGRRLRVGYVGPSFTKNQVAQFLLPVLEAHDPTVVELHLYCADAAAEGALPAAKLRSIGRLSDKDAADLIRRDKIDILIDVWGHTAGSRLGLFAYRPAPIQAAWINFVQTTGLTCMDYILHADSMTAPGTEAYFTEEIWRIGPIVAPSRPAAGRLDPVPTPALKNGYVTFGSFNNPAKLSELTIAAWSLILRERPRDRLVLKYGPFKDPVLQRVTQARFAAYGARPEQLEFRGHTSGADYLREFQDIDLALDPTPCPGGTTSCDALANGVPVLTLKGDDFYARIGLPVLLPCGLGDLVAESLDDYVARALALTEDHRALDALRARVRPSFDASPYCDEVGFTRNIEGVFRQMYDRWRAGTR
jgi:predicted O-linked N-acetylglucosamine transferase (SPINDLY family)